ncbi:MAG: hypothetical protein J4478_05280 [Candidatus Diapherotrites archaeon]|uniref:Uncharacterized protein n=1 Tax=Candidatus Iainarchaeum sp. TaxID=3101447 RepID=A0A7J4JUT4_9ARCH|nr:MAG: hypothetical protein QT12_C0017G0003 [archaeon GW2011_AR21]MBS3058783.1 hypothetical protein [Candidatus Diapherotrites archaeon]HIH21478.1 hypothetical protein [Candidatus Diapherotrites archaeon]HIH33203.1 hypothetical protein [Candidatus Diapherotrites archaeon]
MPFKERSRVLPDNIHEWRGVHWPLLKRMYSEKKGGALIKLQRFNKVVATFKSLKKQGRLSQERLGNQARAIELIASELTDEAIQRLEEDARAKGIEPKDLESWNMHYLKCMRHLWPKIPSELRHEIVRQSKTG